MDEAPQSSPESGGAPPSGPWPQHPYTAASAPPGGAPPAVRRRRWPKAAAAAGIAAGTAVGAAVLAAAATSGTQTPAASVGTDATTGNTGSGSSSSGSGSSTTPPMGPRDGPGFAIGGPGMGRGNVLHGVFTVQGPNGYETLQEQTGTVSDITNTSGSTWSMTVTSADGTALTYVIDSGTSVDGGESGVASISKNDTVHVVAVVSNGTATAKQVMDTTVMQANGQSWRPTPPTQSPRSSSSGTTTS